MSGINRPSKQQPVGEPTARDIVRLQQQIGAVLDQIDQTRRPQLSSEFKEKNSDGTAIVLGTTTVLIKHGLGRLAKWHLADLNADVRVWRDITSTADLNMFLPLKASATVTVKLVIF